MKSKKIKSNMCALPPGCKEALEDWIKNDTLSVTVGSTAVDQYVQAYKSTFVEIYNQTLERLAIMSRVSLPDYLEMTGLEFRAMQVVDDFEDWSLAYADLIACLDRSLQAYAKQSTKEAMERSFPDFQSWQNRCCNENGEALI